MAESIVIDASKCVGCAQCVLICEFDAMQVSYGLCEVKAKECIVCGACIDFCPLRAISRVDNFVEKEAEM